MIRNSEILLGLAVFISAATTITIACPETSVSIYLYTEKTGSDKPCKLTANSCPVESCGFNPELRIVVIIHGWKGSYLGDCPTIIKNAYLDKGKDVNVIVVDYGPCSADYLSAVTWTRQIGQAAAKVVTNLIHSCGLNNDLVECVGHSLGAHICGTFSAALPKICRRITGLDTCSPTIEGYTNDKRLDVTDGRYVTCIHTSSKSLAIIRAFCHSDIYPNSAKSQYSCGNEILQLLTGGCDHQKACDLFAYSILHPHMFPLHKQCDTSDQALTAKCTKTPSTPGYMGDSNYGPNGIFWIDSNLCHKNMNLR